jgi:hypothetical protein
MKAQQVQYREEEKEKEVASQSAWVKKFTPRPKDERKGEKIRGEETERGRCLHRQ